MKTAVDEIMATSIISVRPDATIRDVATMMAEAKVGATAVMENGELQGMFSERDLLNRVVAKKVDVDVTPVKEVMTSPVITIDTGTTANDALYIMTVKHIRHLPVVDKTQKPIGMLGIRDLLECVLNETIDEFITKKVD
ncbi:MAG: CBS domain-containing protein [Bdellovibrionaceae bacterium]|nr:CBS domain-containing protein [Bdellovibrionales bacterium]MCB9084058.1 CBS domain-containing protein [Pseudobdellovibrionaceae bacterium]